jgi:hypothetical protein
MDLKRRGWAADSLRMFFPNPSPDELDPARFTSLRVSLNAPVVRTDELSGVAARAAIVQWWQPDGSCAIEIRLRAVTDERAVVYTLEAPLEAASDVDHALDAALNFAEGMGFLFEEDVLSGEDTVSRAQVAQAWAAFEAGRAPAVSRPAPRPVLAPELGRPGDLLAGPDPDPADPGPTAEPLELTDLAPGEAPGLAGAGAPLMTELSSDWEPLGAGDEPAPGPAAEARVAEPPPPPATLTKFRGRAQEPPPPAAPADAGAAPPARGKALGRLPIVRRKLAEGRQKPGLLVRILGAF